MSDADALRLSVYRCIAETFNISPESLRDDMSATDIQGWDSISTSYLLLNLEEALERELDIEKILETRNIGDMIRVIEQDGRHPG
ncbi:phosphopantetheine-binding protein [Sphingomonas sp. GlSt437]|uniref:phosphopantetheine-binding protein n=1 Tax=Sphingomonas sp. GlSt437 TaxID=3389970 RepID=UPI003A8B1CF8